MVVIGRWRCTMYGMSCGAWWRQHPPLSLWEMSPSQRLQSLSSPRNRLRRRVRVASGRPRTKIRRVLWWEGSLLRHQGQSERPRRVRRTHPMTMLLARVNGMFPSCYFLFFRPLIADNLYVLAVGLENERSLYACAYATPVATIFFSQSFRTVL